MSGYNSVSLSAQFKSNDLTSNLFSSDTSTKKGKRDSERKRTKKEKVIPELDILQLDREIRALFENEKTRISDYVEKIRSILNILHKVKKPYGIDTVILDNLEKLYDFFIQICNEFSAEKTCEHKDNPDITDQQCNEEVEEVEEVNIPEYNSKKTFAKSKEKKESSISHETMHLTYREFLNLYDEVNNLLSRITSIETNNLLQIYETFAGPIIENYKKLLSIPIKTSFMRKQKPEIQFREVKKELLTQFLEIANKFIPIEHTEPTPVNNTQMKCKCGNTELFEESDSKTTCMDCGIENTIPTVTTSYKDSDRVNMHQKYRYLKRSHFKDGIKQFQGKQNKTFAPKFITRANNWLSKNGVLDLLLFKDRNHKDIPDEEKRIIYKNVKKSHIRMFFAEYELVKYYEDDHLFYSILTGNPCADISHLEDVLVKDFDALVDMFLQLKIKRVNFLTNQWILKRLLLKHNFKVSKYSFHALKTGGPLKDHENIYAMLCEKLNWNVI